MNDPLHCVLGVIDLKAGKAVHAVGGQRDHYRPVRCQATRDGDAMSLAQMYLRSGVGGLYVADLDAITHGSPNDRLLQGLIDLECPIWIDAGTIELPCKTSNQSSRIVGTESIDSIDVLIDLREKWSDHADDIILSIDLRDGLVLAGSQHLIDRAPVELATEAIGLGIRNLIVLDLAAVGTASGAITYSICKQIAEKHPDACLASGGGIESLAEVELLKKAGCQRILVGTALHAGRKKFLFEGRTC